MAAADWFAPSIAQPLPAPARKRTRRATAEPVRRTRTRRKAFRVRFGVLWIVAFAVLLLGVVAVNVAALQANVAVHRLENQRADLRAQNQTLASELSAAGSAPIIEGTASKLGLVLAQPQDTTYLNVNK
jgi:cell division protein FtsL